MLKVLKFILIIAVILAVIFYGGAFLLPSKQYFTISTIVPVDPVAAFSKLSRIESFGNSANNQIKISIIDTVAYNEIHYALELPDNKKSMKAGYFIKETLDGTDLLWYLEQDSLSYPGERWEGFLAPYIYHKKIRKEFDTIEKKLSR